MLLRIKSVCVCKILGFSGSSTTTLTLATFPSILGFVRKGIFGSNSRRYCFSRKGFCVGCELF